MKKILLLVIFAVSFCFTSNAQYSAGGGINYGTEIGEIGITAKGIYAINKKFDLSANATMFFPYDYTFTINQNGDFIRNIVTTSIFTINLDLHYNFALGDKLKLYPVAGYNATRIKVKVEAKSVYDYSSSTETETETKIHSGLNLGGGINYQLSEKLNGFAEVKYIVSNYSQGVFTLGLLYSFE
jgi:outer membrane protein X